MKKTLLFEGAGCVPRGDLENCRIRTAFTNDEGMQIYLEIIGCETTKTSAPKFQQFRNYGFIDHAFTITEGEPNYHEFQFVRNYSFEYTRANILDFVNSKLGCSFDEIAIDNRHTETAYRVHREHGQFDLMEDYLKEVGNNAE